MKSVDRRDWTRWMTYAELLFERWLSEVDATDDPYGYNETASVAMLASAAVLAGGIALTEYRSDKRARHDRRAWAKGACRGDLWVAMPSGRTWAFEFKQTLPTRPSSAYFEPFMAAATDDARHVDCGEADLRLAGVVASSWWAHEAGSGVGVDDALRRQLPDYELSYTFGSEHSRVYIVAERL